MTSKRFALGCVCICISSTLCAQSSTARFQSPISSTLSTAIEAYIYGYPLVLMEYTRLGALASGQIDTMNVFKSARRLMTPDDRNIVRPNTDALYTFAFLDLKAEPIILRVPETAGHYYVMQVMDAWSNVFADPGTRTTGPSAQDFAIVGPEWKGHLPRPIPVFRSPTNLVWIAGRTQVIANAPPEGTCQEVNDPEVFVIQDGYNLIPLSRWSPFQTIEPSTGLSSAAPPLALPMPPPEMVAQLTGVQFFQMLSMLMRDNPAAAQDMPALKRFEKIGFVAGMPFSPPAALVPEINAAPANARLVMEKTWDALGTKVNGWGMLVGDIGVYGTDYLTRATIALKGFGANLPEDALYPVTDKSMILNGASDYVIQFDPVPPVGGFWSVTLYDEDIYLVRNSICRYAIHSTDQAIAGKSAVEILLQQNAPADPAKLGYWLPTPPGDFNLTLRMYWPSSDVLKGKWVPPPVQKR